MTPARAAVLSIFVIILLEACEQPTRTVLRPAADAPVTLARAVNAPIERGSGEPLTLGLLVDRSGSMNGFAGELQGIERWIGLAVSGARSWGYDFEVRPTMGFNRAVGVASTTAVGEFRGDTNLDAAVARAAEFDLAVILTDGVAAFGSGGSSKCGATVDAACVGNRLADVMRQSGPRGGFWIVPLGARFDGQYFSERQIDAARVDIGSIAAVADGRGRVAQPRNLPSGELVYRYRGPKTLLMLIVSRNVGAGRALIAGIEGSVGGEGAGFYSEAFELFPGSIPRYEWTSVHRTTTSPNVSKSLSIDSSKQWAVFRSAATGQPAGEWLIRARSKKEGAGAVRLTSIPSADASISWSHAGASFTGLEMEAAEIRLTAVVDETFAASDCASGPVMKVVGRRSGSDLAEISRYATTRPETEPEKVFGLEQIVRSFYTRFGALTDVEIASLRVCRGNV